MESSNNNKPLESIDLCESHHCDITFLVEGKLVRFSRFLLEFHSPVFAAIFSERWSEGKDPSDPIESKLKFDEMQVLFSVLTPNGDRSISFDNVQQLLELGDFYQIGLVASFCQSFLLSNVSSRDHFLLTCGLAATFDLRGLLSLVNEEHIVEKFCQVTSKRYEAVLAVSAKAKTKLDGAFAYVEHRLLSVCVHKSTALHLLIVGYECGSQLLIDKCMPVAARNATLAELLAAKAKLSVGLHCELMLQHHARAQDPKPAAAPRRKSVG